jgi:hypothetical protein
MDNKGTDQSESIDPEVNYFLNAIFPYYLQSTHNNTGYDGNDPNMPLLEWLADNYKRFGAALEIVSDKSQEGAQFVRGFGGLGGKSYRNGDFY